ncbi:MAG: hypothetical protein IJO43_00500 [Bacilli bacterium]|nr:hypothetical protein [Bacilli bacterium]
MDNNKLKKIVIFILFIAIFVMSSAYALLYRNLRINGNASVIASWKVGITSIKEGAKTGNAVSTSVPSYTISTANFDAQLENPNDSIEYIITIENSGKIDAKLNDITSTQSGNTSIVYEIIGINENDVLKAGESIEVKIKVSLKDTINIDGAMNSSITIVFSYIQHA